MTKQGNNGKKPKMQVEGVELYQINLNIKESFMMYYSNQSGNNLSSI